MNRVRVQWDCDGLNLLVSIRDDGRGNLTGTLRGTWKVDTHWWGYPVSGAPYSGEVCRGSVPATPVSATLA